jgi:transposase
MNLGTGSRAVTEGPLQVLKDERALTKQAVSTPQPTPKSGQPAGDGATGEAEGTTEVATTRDTVVVQFSILYDGDQEKFDRLWAMRDCMHRVLNTAISEWHRADKVASKTNPDKETLARGPVTDAVKALLERERDYWAKQVPKAEAEVEKLRVNLGRATAKELADEVASLEKRLEFAQKRCASLRIKATNSMPSSVYDSAVRYTAARYAIYKKDAFRGDRSNDTYRAGQPIRWRDGSWSIEAGDRKGRYNLTLELHSDGRSVTRDGFTVLPDGGSMHAYAKKMLSGEAKLCDARVVYSERKKQWFAKLTIRLTRTASRPLAGTTAALRRGVWNALVLVFENGSVLQIGGGDVLAFKRKLKARKVSIGEHMGQMEAGDGARGRGKRRRFAALRKIDDAEDRFIDTRCNVWARSIATECANRGVSRLLVAKMNPKEMDDGLPEVVQALLRQWPFARLLDRIKQACAKIYVDDRGRATRDATHGIVSVEVAQFDAHWDARGCPNCRHVHADRQPGPTWKCEVCAFERPCDQIVAWNGLVAAVGAAPLEKMARRKAATGEALTKALGKGG